MRKNIQRQLHENALKPKHSNLFHKYAIFSHLRQPSDSQPHTPHSHASSTLRLPRKAFSATRKSLFHTAKQPLAHRNKAFLTTQNSLSRNTKPPFPPPESKKMIQPNLFSRQSALPRTFRKTYFTKKRCQYFLLPYNAFFIPHNTSPTPPNAPFRTPNRQFLSCEHACPITPSHSSINAHGTLQ